jgi:hypothetical protein
LDEPLGYQDQEYATAPLDPDTGQPRTEIMPELTPQQGDRVPGNAPVGVRRQQPRRDARGPADRHPRALERGDERGVESPAGDAVDNGYRVIVLFDCCSAGSEAAHTAAVENFGLITTEVTDSADFNGALG